MTKVRLAKQSDVNRLAELMLQLGYSIESSVLIEKLATFSSSQNDAVFVAELSDEVIGFISCHITTLFHQPGNSGRITILLVDQSVRGSGIGKQLVDTAEEYFSRQHCVKIEVTSGLDRIDAHHFYEALGYHADNLRFIKTASA